MDLYTQFPDSSLNLDDTFQPLLQTLTTHKITTLDLISTPVEDIFKRVSDNISIIQLKLFINLLRDEMQARFEKIAATAPSHNDLVSTGDDKLDYYLNGGYSGLVEVFGESSTGKSQLCFQLMKAITNLGQKCVYIATEGGNFQSNRLKEIGAMLENIYMISCHDLESQEHIINYQLPNLLKRDKSVRLVIIDSISHHIRVELNHGRGNYYQKYINDQKYISKISQTLQSYIESYGVAVVLTNQITSKPVKQIVNSDLKRMNFDYQLGWLTGMTVAQIQNIQENRETVINIPTLGLNLWNFCNLRIGLMKKYKPNPNASFHRDEGDTFEEEKFWLAQRYLKVCYNDNEDDEYDYEEEDPEGGDNSYLGFRIDKNGVSSIN